METPTGTGGPCLVVRCDATRAIGMGHLTRSLAVADEWLSRGMPAVWVGELDSPLGSVPWPPGLDPHPLAADERRDIRSLVTALKGSPRPWVVLMDGYDFGESYLGGISEEADFVVALEDFRRFGRYPVDLLVNPGGSTPDLDGAALGGGESVQGPEYRIIDRRFRRVREPVADVAQVAKNLLVTLGGTDPDDVTGDLLEGLLETGEVGDMSVRVVLGPGYPFADRLQQRLAALQTARLPAIELVVSADMPKVMLWADMAVSAAGGTAAELAFMGVPALLVPWAANQRPNAALLSERGAAMDLGWDTERRRPERPVELSALATDAERRRRMSEAGRSLIDGRGSARIVDHVLRRMQRMVR